MIFLNKECINKNIEIMRMLNNGGLPLGARLRKLTERGEWVEYNLCYLANPYKVKYDVIYAEDYIPKEIIEHIVEFGLNEDVRKVAVDRDGDIFGYNSEVIECRREWVPLGGACYVQALGSIGRECPNFKEMVWDADLLRELAAEYNKTTNHVSQKGNE